MFSNHIGDQILNAKLDGTAPRLFYSATRKSTDGTVYLKLVNATSEPQTVHIQLTGASAIDKSGKLIAMSAKTTAATNSITQPSAIVPVETGLKDVASQFSHTMPGYSIQILQLKAR